MGVITRTTGRLIQSDPINGTQQFWKAELNGKSVTIHFGQVGTPGHRGSREFPNIEAAERFLAQRVRQKLGEGYKPVLSDKRKF
ncbi:MAG: WGR domain-containing protein [Candidatus Odinarchaeota archaeon]|nr:WGR domain-containing protein [Candidatus Thorarchaeota archaeon]